MKRSTRLAPLATLCLVVSACAGGTPATSSTAATPTQPVPSPVVIGPFPSDQVAGIRAEADITYTDVTDCGGRPCRVPGDVLAPLEGSDHPTVVLLAGGSTAFANRRYQAPLAVELAERGVVVFMLSYRSAVTGNYDSDSLSDARCAVLYARAHAATYGGDPDRVVVVGHSMGGFLGLSLVLEPEPVTDADACLTDGDPMPDAVIGLGAPRPRSGGEADAAAPPLWLFAGTEDGDADGAAAFLRDAGYNAQSRELPGVTHDAITDVVATPEIVDLILEAIDEVS